MRKMFITVSMLLVLTCTPPTLPPGIYFDGYNVESTQVNEGQTIEISVLLRDQSRSDLSFMWLATDGTIKDPRKETILWTAPDVETTVTITVVVTDEKGKSYQPGNLVLPVLMQVEAIPTPQPSPELTPTVGPYTLVKFNDLNLETAIRGVINKPSENIFYKDVSGITELILPGKEIVDLKGLEYFSNLTNINLQSNQISDLSPLSGLIYLTSLDLDCNQISDISLLNGLMNLENLHIDTNKIVTVNLKGLNNLIVLNLHDNQISSLSFEGLSNLETLFLHNNQISDISSIQKLTSLTGLNLLNNPLDSEAKNTIIPALQTTGISVSY